MTDIERLDLIFDIGQRICAAYTGFSKTEVAYCLQKSNWLHLSSFLMSNDPYEALVHFSLHPLSDVLSYFQMFIACMVQFPDERQNARMQNLLEIVDTQTEFDDALTNAKMMRALLAVNAKYIKSSPNYYFMLFYNCKRLLAHVFKKFPDYLKLNILKTNRKSKSLRFKPEEIEMFW